MQCNVSLPALFADDALVLERSSLTADLTQSIRAFEARLQPLTKAWEALTAAELAAIGADDTIASIADAWEANSLALRTLLLPVPPIVRALPAGCDAPAAAFPLSCGGSSSGGGSTYSSGEMVLAHLARDWSSHGAIARQATHAPVLRYVAAMRANRPLRVLVPGAGACRLAWELARIGHRVEANDASITMLTAARAMIGRVAKAAAGGDRGRTRTPAAAAGLGKGDTALRNAALRIVPRAGCAGGVSPRASTCLGSAFVPDHSGGRNGHRPSARRSCSAVGAAVSRLTLQAGPWCESYSSNDHVASFDLVVTCYFLDTLADPAAAIRHVRKLLRPGGVWLNVGPLHWHDAPGTLRFSLSELLALIKLSGFQLHRQRSLGAVPYLSAVEPKAASWAAWTPHGVGAALRRALRGRGRGSAVEGEEERHDVVFWAARVPK